MTAADGSTDDLLRRAGRGDRAAVDQLLEGHRPRVRQLVAVRLDRRLSARVDPSDVVQETLAEAARRLDEYLRGPAVPFYPWLRDLAMNRLIDLHRRHLLAARRSVRREERRDLPLPDESAIALAERLVGAGTSPSRHLERQDQRRRVRVALERLESEHREVLVLKYLEGLDPAEIAAILDVSDRTVRRRHREAVERLGAILGE